MSERRKQDEKKKFEPPNLDEFLEGRKRSYVSYLQGAKLYSMEYYSFVKLAKAAKANKRLRKAVIVDLDILDAYMENLQKEAGDV